MMTIQGAAGLPASGFTPWMVTENRLCRGDGKRFRWIFHDGMGFGERRAWWREGTRRVPHEGLDILYYRCGDDAAEALAARALVCPLYPGELVAMTEDFLGTTLWLRHEGVGTGAAALYGAMGHLAPLPGLGVGARLSAAEALGRIAAGKVGRRVPAHLHISLFVAPGGVDPRRFDWGALPDSLRFLDPAAVLQP
ncbi:MAG: hypothetical protein AB1568_10960 [Thermodesulfobacteriota bacterium]